MLSTLQGAFLKSRGGVCALAQPSISEQNEEDRTYNILSKGYPMVVMKLEVNESSEKRSSRQLFPTPTCVCDAG